jgi:formate hydrogenlyase subunit 6/NADH:ubiquinone oxidoreductase subunit I
MICPVSAITMSKVWDTVVTDRLSRDTMSEREIKRRPRPKEEKASSNVGSESQELTAEDPPQTPTADSESGPANE